MSCFPCRCEGACNISSKRCCSERLPQIPPTDLNLIGCVLEKILAIVNCPRDWVGVETVKNCAGSLNDWSMTLPVTDLETRRTFRNKDCAACHRATSLVTWSRAVTCQVFQYVFSARSEDDLLRLASTGSHTTCDVQYTPPAGASLLKCVGASRYFSEVIATCNTTGRWAAYDSDVEEWCLKYFDIYFRVISTGLRVYQNIFCAICNGDQPQVTGCVFDDFHSSFISVPNHLPPLTLLLGLSSRPSQEGARHSVECASHQWQIFDDQKREREGVVICYSSLSGEHGRHAKTTWMSTVHSSVSIMVLLTIPTANTPWLVSPTTSEPLCTNMNCFPCDCDGACDFSSRPCCSLAFRTSSAVVSYVGCLVDSFLAVMKCPEHWSDEETTVREDCERNPKNHLLAEPVTDMESGKNFQKPELCHLSQRQFIGCVDTKSAL
ncbi:hypothetical protein C0Q70_00084 [Pomacea canaliculata]|uniref:SMB domain-containing protein n=1 Tax=Pomacea canaliculata TaxID=400727 RepID=A0A2T7PVP5_POMCA|nr:hypothetical protein C0Q70_00084 [Pomacea canaliculata]